jgi:AcrR family transcriptional regulator
MAKKKARELKAKPKAEPENAVKQDYPLRNKRRLETRAALIKSAQRLMAEHGFEAVTMQQVADDAGTHAQTLYSHFPNKYALSAAAAVEWLRIALDGRKIDTLIFWRTWVEKRSSESLEAENGGPLMTLVSDMKSNPKFALVNLAVTAEYIDVLSQSLAEDFGMDAKVDLFPKLVAEMLMAGSEHHIFAWYEADGDYDLLAGEISAVDEVTEIVKLVCKKRGIKLQTPK